MQGVVGELLCPPDLSNATQEVAPLPFVLLRRYRDNVYLVFANIPTHLSAHVQFAEMGTTWGGSNLGGVLDSLPCAHCPLWV